VALGLGRAGRFVQPLRLVLRRECLLALLERLGLALELVERGLLRDLVDLPIDALGLIARGLPAAGLALLSTYLGARNSLTGDALTQAAIGLLAALSFRDLSRALGAE
jgi:hypothetical protein